MKRLKLFIASVSVLLGLSVAAPVLSFAATTPSTPAAPASTSKSEVCDALGSSADCTKTPAGSVGLNGTVKAIISILSLVVGVIAVIMIIVSGIRFVTAGGDSNNISAARSTLTYAIVGLVVVAAAQALVKFVLNKVT